MVPPYTEDIVDIHGYAIDADRHISSISLRIFVPTPSVETIPDRFHVMTLASIKQFHVSRAIQNCVPPSCRGAAWLDPFALNPRQRFDSSVMVSYS
jgi:hypothetical protein